MDVLIYILIIYVVLINPLLIFLVLRGFTFAQKILFIIGSELSVGGLIVFFIFALGRIPFVLAVPIGLMLFAIALCCYGLSLRGIVT